MVGRQETLEQCGGWYCLWQSGGRQHVGNTSQPLQNNNGKAVQEDVDGKGDMDREGGGEMKRGEKSGGYLAGPGCS